MTISRRSFSAGMIASALFGRAHAAEAPPHDMSMTPKEWVGSEQIAMLMYPGFTALDLVGPQYMFGNLMGATVHLVAKTREPVMSDTKLAIAPSATLEECPRDLDILFVPGGSSGTLSAMRDEAIMAFVKDRGKRAKYVTSVCTGSLILGAAGLLQGYRATSHWITRDLLPLFGAEAAGGRYVIDRNRITGAGVTAGVDFGLAIVEQRRGRDYAKAIQLLAEYDPTPPLDAGTPEKAGPETTKLMADMFAGFRAEVATIAEGR
ncbi:MAG: DJ-1/PfpI family protein [Hyphomicrobiales bacterium]|nr:DJ-1/PfpI family protein [Hyphomicrobiales bacterium]